MKRLILLLLLPLLACSHEHPLTDRQHDHNHEYELADHNHHYPFPDGLPFAYILSVDPPLAGPGVHKFGVLTRTEHDMQPVYIDFSTDPKNFTFTNIYYPGEHSTPVEHVDLSISHSSWAHINRARVWTDCSDPEHEGYIAFRLDWDTGSARFFYSCPEEEE